MMTKTKKKGGRLFLAGGLLRAVSRCTLGERVFCFAMRGSLRRPVVLIEQRWPNGNTRTSASRVTQERHTKVDRESRVGSATSGDFTERRHGASRTDICSTCTMHQRKKLHATEVYRFHLTEVQDDAEEERLLEEVTVDSDIVGATTSERGGQSSQKGGGESSTKECGESSQE